MNCEICAMKFTRLKDVIRHGMCERRKHTHFFCIPCALSLSNVTDVVHHIMSMEHFIMALATGVCFDTGSNSDFACAAFPPHNCCLLCSTRDGTSNNNHLKTHTHKYTAWLLRTMITTKKIYIERHASSTTRALISKLINAKRNTSVDDVHSRHKLRDSFVCELCNLHFVKQVCLDQHLADKSHKRMKEFMLEISLAVKGLDIVGAGFDANVFKTFSNSLIPLYCCEVCCMWVDTRFNYIQHVKSNKHRNTELIRKRSNKRKMDDSVVSAGIVHRYPKLKSGRYLSSREERRTVEQYSRKDVYAVGDCRDEDVSKELKSPAPHPNHHSVCAKHHKTSELVQSGKKNCSFKASETVGKSFPPVDFGDGETKCQSEVCQTVSSSLQPVIGTSKTSRLDMEDGEIVDNSRQVNPEGADSDKEHYCELCDFLCYKSLHYEKHLVGAQHKRMRRLINRKCDKYCTDTERLVTTSGSHSLRHNCELCDVLNRSYQEYEFHLNSATHKENQRMLYLLKQRPL